MHAWALRLTGMATGVTSRHLHGATVYYRRPSGKIDHQFESPKVPVSRQRALFGGTPFGLESVKARKQVGSGQ